MGWIVAGLCCLIAFETLAILGAMREVVILRGEMKAFEQLIKRPPPPSYVDDILPQSLVELLEATDVRTGQVELLQPTGADTSQMVAFVSPGCGPCEEFINGLTDALEQGRLRSEELFFVVWAMHDEDAERLARRLPARAVIDTGSLARACEIRATPTVFITSRTDHTVLDYNLEGQAEWVVNHLKAREAIQTAS